MIKRDVSTSLALRSTGRLYLCGFLLRQAQHDSFVSPEFIEGVEWDSPTSVKGRPFERNEMALSNLT